MAKELSEDAWTEWLGSNASTVVKAVYGTSQESFRPLAQLIVARVAHYGLATPPAQAEIGEWQPIETAPKDGTTVWLSNGRMMRLGFWNDGKKYENHGSVGGGWRDFAKADNRGACDLHFLPTHWQPLPKP